MSRFSADWLAQRNPAVLDAVTAWCKDIFAIRIVDLGCGTGSTLRALAPRLPRRQDWRLFDNDFDLVARAAAIAPPATVTVTATPLDMSRDLEASLDGSIDLIAASALLDLCFRKLA